MLKPTVSRIPASIQSCYRWSLVCTVELFRRVQILFEHLEVVRLSVVLAGWRTEDLVNVALRYDSTGTRAFCFGLELGAEIIHVRFARLDFLRALNTIPIENVSIVRTNISLGRH